MEAISTFFATKMSEMTLGQSILGGIGAAAIGSVGGAVAQSAFAPDMGGGGGGGGTVSAPTPQEPAVAPLPDDQAAGMARRRQIAAIQQRSGRASTILSDISQGDRLGA